MKKYNLAILTIILCLAAGAVMICASTPSSIKGAASEAHFMMEKTYNSELHGKAESEFDASAVLVGGVPAPCDKAEKTFYIPQERGADELTGAVKASSGNARICILDDADAAGGNLSKCIEEGHRFRAAVTDESSYMEMYIIFTGLPAICLFNEDGEIERKEEHQGNIRVFDPESDAVLKTPCSFHVRGNTSVLFDKKSYKIELNDGRGNNVKENILGLRKDDDWILNSLYTDCTMSREKICYTLWERVNEMEEEPVAAPSMEYVEVFLNDRYMGVYGLMFPVDRKLMDLIPGDILYKVTTWKEELTAPGKLTDYNGEEKIVNENGFAYASIEYPKDGEGSYIWDPLMFYQDFVFETQDLNELAEKNVTPDRDNFVLHELFSEMTHATDNTWKNLFIAARRDKNGGYVFTETIWDLNYTFGDIFVWDPENGNTVFDPGSAAVCKLRYGRDYGFTALEIADPSYEQDADAKWKRWRQGGIDADYVIGLFRKEREILTKSGAFARDCARWDKEITDDEYYEMIDSWIRNRFSFLDNLRK